jgi:ABC-2 type transport system permease protein
MGIMSRFRAGARVFFTSAYYSYIALFRWFRPTTYMASKVVMPLAQILFFTLLGMYAQGRESASFFVIGNAVQLAAINGTYGVTMSVGGERWAGTMGYLFGAPASRMLIFVGRAFMHVIDGMLGVVLGLLWGMLLLGVDLSQTDLAALALTIIITAASTSGMGLLLGCLSLITRNIMFINNTVYFLMLAICGANVPVSSLPRWVQSVSYALPLTRGIASARELVGGASLQSVAALLRGELAVGAAYVLVGYVLFRQFEIQAKKRGTLEVM